MKRGTSKNAIENKSKYCQKPTYIIIPKWLSGEMVVSDADITEKLGERKLLEEVELRKEQNAKSLPSISNF